jgi:hypothetical protein
MRKFSSRRSVLQAVACLAVLGGCSSGDKPSTSQEPDGHSRMLEVLAGVAKRTDQHEYIGTARLDSAREVLESLPENAPLHIRFDVNRVLGGLEIQAGKNRDAIDHLSVAYRLLPYVEEMIDNQISELVVMGLAIAHLRVAETENCVHCYSGESCLFPIQNTGIHEKRFGSTNAVKYLEEVLERNPEELTARWLLNVAMMTLGRYPQDVPEEFLIPPEVFASDEEFPRFKSISKQVGLNTFSLSGGSIVDDFDGDGYLDIVTSTWHTKGQIRYFRNDVDGTFSDRTQEANLAGIFGGLNLIQADYDNDGDVDVLVLRGAWLGVEGRKPNSLLENDGHGRFNDVTFAAGLAETNYPSHSAAWADYDNDGDLDLYVGNEGYPSQLFRNNGDKTFIDVASEAGVDNPPASADSITKGVVWGDYDGDRLPDLYISNFGGANRLYRNQENGTFTDVAQELGITGPIQSFPVWFWDFDNDGTLDIFVSSYERDMDHIVAAYLGMPHDAEPACLYRGDGEGGFVEVAKDQNLTACSAPMGANFGDVDGDGYLDFYLGTGWPDFDALVPNLMFRNRGGAGFADVTTAGGFGHLQKGHGIAFADLDNDGDQDVFIEMGGAFGADGFVNALFENPGTENHWIKVKLMGDRSNRSGVGARIRVEIIENGKPRSIYKHVNSGGSFGANPLRQEIGLGQAGRIAVLEVFWPTTNTTQTFRDVDVDQVLEIREGQDEIRRIELQEFDFPDAGTDDLGTAQRS